MYNFHGNSTAVSCILCTFLCTYKFFSFDTTESRDISFLVLLRKQTFLCRSPLNYILFVVRTTRAIWCKKFINYSNHILQIQMRWFMMMCPEKTLTPTQVCDINNSFIILHRFSVLVPVCSLKPVRAAYFHLSSFFFILILELFIQAAAWKCYANVLVCNPMQEPLNWLVFVKFMISLKSSFLLRV